MKHAVALAFAVLAMPAAARGKATGSPLVSIIGMDGRCTRLAWTAASGMVTDHTDDCSGKLLNSSFLSGRSEYTFIGHHGAHVSFITEGRSNIHQGEMLIAPVYAIATYAEGDKAEPMVPAVGSCRFGNPYAGKATIACHVDTSTDTTDAVFETNGDTPKTEKF